MLNEAMQWTALVVLGFLALGLLRQMSLLLPPESRTPGTGGPRIGERLPRPLLARLEESAPSWRQRGEITIAFVAERCVGCQKLLAELDSSPDLKHPLVLVARRPTPEFAQAIRNLGVPTVVDGDELWKTCRVSATPLLVRVSEEGRVLNKEVTHRVDSVAR